VKAIFRAVVFGAALCTNVHAAVICDLTEEEQIAARELGRQFAEGEIGESDYVIQLAAIAPLECFQSGAISDPIDPPVDHTPPED
jgi:hypothetical protein